MSDLRVDGATTADAVAVRDVIHEAFASRPLLSPPGTALAETTESVAEAISRDGGLICRVDGVCAGAVLFADDGDALRLRRVSATPHFQSRGVASAIVGVAEDVAAARGYDDVLLHARAELPATVRFWLRRGYAEVSAEGHHVTLGKALPTEIVAATDAETREVGERIAGLVAASDVVLLTGELGAGKTTLTQGLGAALGVRGGVTSPTFVISRVHPSTVGGPALVHVDAYRLGDRAELDDLDIDAFVDEAVTVVEWGEGVAEALSDAWIRVHIRREHGSGEGEGADARVITVSSVGKRWVGARVRSTLLGGVGG